MKNIKKIIAVICLILICGSLEIYAQTTPPTPPAPPTGPGERPTVTPENVPVGTATALLIGLAGGCIAYKVRRNSLRKENE